MSIPGKRAHANRADMELQDIRSLSTSDRRSPPSDCSGISHDPLNCDPVSADRQSRTDYSSRMKRNSSGAGNPDRSNSTAASHYPGDSSGSQTHHYGLPPYPHPHSYSPDARNDQTDDVSLPSDSQDRFSSGAYGAGGRGHRGMKSSGQLLNPAEKVASNESALYGSGRSNNSYGTQRGAAMTEDVLHEPDPEFNEADIESDYMKDNLSRKEENDYERLHRGPSASQHLHRPVAYHPGARPAQPNTSNVNMPRRQRPHAPPPVYNAVTSQYSHNARPESHPFLQKPAKNTRRTDGADDIIELQSEVKTLSSPEEKQNRSNARKDQPEITEIPNTNFAIACMVAFCFNLPFGVLAMYFSLRAVKAYQDGRAKLGERRSRWSIVLSLLGITITTVIISSVVLYIAMQGQKRISRHKAYGTKGGLNL